MWFAFRCCSALVIIAGILASSARADSELCRYRTWEWNTLTKQAQNHREVLKPYQALTEEEIDPHSACTICESDQHWVRIEGVPPFQICKHFSSAVEATLLRVIDSGFPIHSISAYRVGRTKGEVDGQGLRTRFSHHSFGTAIDINSGQNGLYSNCIFFGNDCQLLRGGPWYPDQPGAVTKESVVYQEFRNMEWKWGGELSGRQKDFMHFSLSGD